MARALILSLFVLCCSGSALNAQVIGGARVVTSQNGYLPLDLPGELPAALAQGVRIRMDEAPLEHVLEAIAAQAGLGLSYGQELVRSNTRVSLRTRHISAGAALRLAVHGTPWQILYTAGGQVTVVRRPAVDDAAPASGRIVGRVTDDQGRPLAGVHVVTGHLQRGIVTDSIGRFEIVGLLPGPYALRATLPGYRDSREAARVVAERSAQAHIRMSPNVIVLDELVAIGYGEVRRRDVTGSVSSLRPAQMVESGAAGAAVSNALVGRLAGVRVLTHSATPGVSASVRIRGINSISASTEPLFVVDGIPITAGSLNLSAIDPGELASIQILKDASATAIYGARGANGVVLIHTRRGRPGTNVVSFETSFGLQKPSRFIPALNSVQFMELVNEGRMNAGLPPAYSLEQIEGAPYFDYPRALLRDLKWQPQMSHSLTISGGDERTRYLMSGSHSEQEGIVLNSGFSRTGTRLNLDRVVTDRFRVGVSLSGTRLTQRVNGAESTGSIGPSITGITAATMYDPTLLPRDPESGEWNKSTQLSENFLNPYTETVGRDSPIHTSTLLATLFAELDLTERMVLRTSLAGNASFRRQLEYSPRWIGSGQNIGLAKHSVSERREITHENQLTYSRPLGQGRVEVLAGASLQTSTYETMSASGRGLPVDLLAYLDLQAASQAGVPTSHFSEWSLISQLGRVNYNVLGRYLFTFTARRDGSSRFGAANKWATFPSAAFAWRLVDEPRLRTQQVFSDLKLRLSIGRTGNQAIAEYQSLSRMNPVFTAVGTDTDVVTLVPSSSAPNPHLKWETHDQVNAGLDMGFIQNRVSISLEVYRAATRNLLLNVNLPRTSGYSSQIRNVGAVSNRGVEVSITSINLEGDRYSWGTTLNLAANRNRVSQLYGDLNGLEAGSSTQLGQPLGTFVGHQVLGLYQPGDECGLRNQAECAAGEYRILDVDGNGVIDHRDRVNLGSPQADLYGGFSSDARWGPLGLNAFFNFSVGNEVNNQAMRYLGLVGGASNERADRALARWTPEAPHTDVPRANLLRPNNRTYSTYIENGSFLRLQALTLGCDLRAGLLPGAGMARLTLSGENLWITTRYSGYDPEQAANDSGGYPRARSWTMGLSVTL